ncbi:hypothetical protein E2C01_097553 [Portunus trituberculatus]|uniref:Uncharacterized protein n=1 Tax=Portunus trituberculatus TaxID=210409 RepID=A0A5B7KA88_PORTR|nr:hypothetical protein [Portunus trituberculatus]
MFFFYCFLVFYLYLLSVSLLSIPAYFYPTGLIVVVVLVVAVVVVVVMAVMVAVMKLRHAATVTYVSTTV